MDGVLFETVTDVACATNLMGVVPQLRPEVVELRQEVAACGGRDRKSVV